MNHDYLEYNKMLVCGISDSHFAHRDLDMPAADILVIAGDFLYHGTFRELIKFNEWLGLIKVKYPLGIFVLNGNHELELEGNEHLIPDYLTNAKFCFDEEVNVSGKRIYFTSWMPQFYDWAYMKTEAQLENIYARIPEGLDLLVTHSPPKGILDRNRRGDLCGSYSLYKRLREMAKPPSVHSFGHIHAFEVPDASNKKDYRDTKFKKLPVNKEPYEEFGTRFINLSIMSEQYSPDYPPTVFEI